MTLCAGPDHPPSEATGHGPLRCALHLVTPEGLTRPGVVRPGDALVLCVEARAAERARHFVVEFWRGDCLRDRWDGRFARGTGLALAFRLHWSAGCASARLSCRILLDGQEVARRSALVGPGPTDAQGRFAEGPAVTASSATLLAFADELRQQLADGLETGTAPGKVPPRVRIPWQRPGEASGR